MWVKKGFCRPIPIEYQEEEEKFTEVKNIEALMKKKGKLTGEETIKETTTKIEEELENLDLNPNKETEETPNFCTELSEFYVEKKEIKENDENENYPEGFDEISDEEQEDFTIHNTDSVIVCGTAQDDFSNLEIYIYDEINQNLYVHHDIMLSVYPLCIEWLPIDLSSSNSSNNKANYAIVGSFLPEIEIWNLDLIEAIEPELVLGQSEEEMGGKSALKKLKKKKKESDLVHTDAVLCLNSNPFNKAILASGSADKKIIIWDIATGKNLRTIKEHKDKVQIVKWNRCEDNVLLSGAFDKTVRLFDMRTQAEGMTVKLSSDIESADWCPLNSYQFLTSFEDGRIELYDIRKMGPVFDFKAHKKAVTNVSFSFKHSGLFSSVSLDGYVKIWDGEKLIEENNVVAPNMIMEKYLKQSTGEIFTCAFSPDSENTIAAGGSKGELFIWQLEESPAFCSRYGIKQEEDIIPDRYHNIARRKVMANRLKMRKGGNNNRTNFNEKKNRKK
jgi:periodic tryptophan protein 1